LQSRLQTLNLVPLRSAVFCVNCETISDSRTGACPACGSPSLISMARLLGGSGQDSATRSGPGLEAN
jgi:hypothetical protein